ncbi:MAG TPA: response regulator [Anaerolineaceae bacterium]
MSAISVLLVDNNPLLAQLLMRFFYLDGRVRVTTVNSTEEDPLTAAGLLAPDGVLLDLTGMGEGSFSFLRALRALLPNCLIVALDDTTDQREAVIAAGANSLMLKTDVNLNFMVNVHNWLKRHKRSAGTLRPLPNTFLRAPQSN